MTSPAADTMISRADVLWRRVLDGVLIRPIGATDTILLEGTGVALWELLDQPRRFDRLCSALAENHGVASHTVAVDIEPVLDDLGARRVLSVD